MSLINYVKTVIGYDTKNGVLWKIEKYLIPDKKGL